MNEQEKAIADKLLSAASRALDNSSTVTDACYLIQTYLTLKRAPRPIALDTGAIQETP